MDELHRLREEMSELRRQQRELGLRLEAVDQRLSRLGEHGPEEEITPASEPETPAAGLPPAVDDAAPGPSLESRIGGIWLNRVGVVAFILGAAYFMKHAFDQGWINEVTRVLIGAGAGLLFLALGERIRRRGFTGYATGLTGGGIALLYFSTFAALYFYDLLAPAVALTLMVMITALAVVISVVQNAPAVAILGLLTGFFTPVLFATPDLWVSGLFTYLLILNAGLVAVTCLKRWGFVGITAFILTHLILLVPGLASHLGGLTPEMGTFAYQTFLTLFLLLFTAMACIYAYRLGRPATAGSVFVLVGAGAGHWVLGWLNLQPAYPDHMGYFTLGLAAFYLLLGLGLRGLRPQPGSSFTAYAMTAALLVLFVPVQLDGPWLTAGWIVQAGVLGYLGNRLNDRRVRAGGWTLLVLSLIRLLAGEWGIWVDPAEYVFLWNRPLLLGLLYVGVLVLTAWTCHRYRGGLAGASSDIRLLAGSAIVLFMAFLSSDVDRWGQVMVSLTGDMTYYRNLSMMAISLLWASCAGALALAGFLSRQRLLRYAAMALLGVTVLKVFMVDLRFLELIYRVVSLVVLGLILLAVSYYYQLARGRGEDERMS